MEGGMGRGALCYLVLSRTGRSGECGGRDDTSTAECTHRIRVGAGDIDRALCVGVFVIHRGGRMGSHRIPSFRRSDDLGQSLTPGFIEDHGWWRAVVSLIDHDRPDGAGGV